ncbi:5-formyltetrahydrofolate cyclo-ligase [Kiritimatiellaeota bacterium B1221]|nr:5-formyltetrahydrofolate cyclo-ligase [Kiritimatiellaeota bacterium B1221]
MKTKNKIRQELKALIGRLSPEEKQHQSSLLCDKLLQDPGILSAKTLGIFLPLPDEPDLRPAFQILLEHGTRIALPFPRKSDADISVRGPLWSFHWIHDLAQTRTGPWNLTFPEAGGQVNVTELDTVLIPGRGFTLQGNRIGRGKGYYDRLLKNHQGRRIGIGFSCQLREHLPVEPHDIPLTEIWI